MGYQEHKQKAPQSVNCAVLTISDSRTEEDDESGKLIRQKLSQNGHRVISYSILKNDKDSIGKEIHELLRQEAMKMGVQGYLEKPFDLKQLEEAMGVSP